METLITAVIIGVIGGVLTYIVTSNLKGLSSKREEIRMLKAINKLSKGDLSMTISDKAAAEEANIHDYRPVIDRLIRREDITIPAAGYHAPGFYVLTERGRQRITKPRSRWRRWLSQ